MVAKKTVNIRIQEISIKNYKGIDKLKLSFPEPIMEDDPDIFAIGSKNGVGKTSVLECCSLLLSALHGNEKEGHMNFRSSPIDVPDLLIRAGAKQAEIDGTVEVNNKPIKVSIKIRKDASSTFNTSKKSGIEDGNLKPKSFSNIICGIDPNPLLTKNFLFFHCHRKMNEGNIDPEMIGEETSKKRISKLNYRNDLTSPFKLIMLRSFMALSEYYEAGADDGSYDNKENKSNRILRMIDDLLKEYSPAEIGKFSMSISDRASIYLRVKDKETEELFNIDGMSSGQKDIISTIFLIWHYSENNPCVVLIDEPELHQNAEWHRKFISHITELAPNNQYIIATHSEHVMDAVDSDRRALLVKDN